MCKTWGTFNNISSWGEEATPLKVEKNIDNGVFSACDRQTQSPFCWAGLTSRADLLLSLEGAKALRQLSAGGASSHTFLPLLGSSATGHTDSSSKVQEVSNSQTAGWGECAQLAMEATAAEAEAVQTTANQYLRWTPHIVVGGFITAVVIASDCSKSDSTFL